MLPDLPDQRLDQITPQDIRDLIDKNLITRDRLGDLAEVVDDKTLAEIIRRLAIDCGGNASTLQQLASTAGERHGELAEECLPDPVASRATNILTRMLERARSERAVLDEARAAERKLKQDYDQAIDSVDNAKVGAKLCQQRENVAFGESVLKKVRPEESEEDCHDDR